MRVITQNFSQRAADIDAFTILDTDVTGPFPLALPLDGALFSTNVYNGVAEVDLSDGVAVLVGFTTGATGSTEVVTITGRNQFGNPLVEEVTMPGASGAVSSVNTFSFIESMFISGNYTNLSVGIIGADDQFMPWVPWDINQSVFNTTVSIEIVSGSADFTLEHTIQADFLRNGPEPDNSFDEGSPFAGATVTVEGNLIVPVTASRVRLNSGTAAVLRAKFLQTGGGYR